MKLGRGFSVVFADGADDSYSVSAFAGRRPSFSKQRVGGGGGGNPWSPCNALGAKHLTPTDFWQNLDTPNLMLRFSDRPTVVK